MLITVLGPGCPSCKQLHERVLNVVKDNKDINVEYITDISVMIEMGLMASPALLIDNKIAFVGRVPSEEEIKEKLNMPSEEVFTGCSCGSC